ncbi:MAG: mechanosensitive ion channel family protein [Thermoplasmatales archaeon]|nr:mechanosensitive ion channel family protein [Thermoplasmatales archaeon]
MISLDDIFAAMNQYKDILELIAIIIISFIIFNIVLKLIKKSLLEKVKTKKQRSNVTVFTDLLKYLFAFFLIIIGISVYSGKLGDLGFVAGLLTVAVGWALQKPISGVVAWLILVTRQPFHIGDRVIISNMKGDVTNITLTHIFLDEVGGTIDGEEGSGRTVMIPTSVIFEQEVINYTQRDDYILDEVVTAITYESDLKKAEEIVTDAVDGIMESVREGFPKRIRKDSHVRLMFQDSGIDVIIRYYTIATRRNEVTTSIRREIWNSIRKTPSVEFAYPHTEVLFQEKTTNKK